MAVSKRTWKTKAGEPREAWIVDFRDKSGKRHKRHFDKKKLADAYETEVMGQIKAGTFSDQADKKTVADACAGYIKALKTEVEKNEVTDHYYRTTKGQLLNYVSPDSDEAKEHLASMHEKTRDSIAKFDKGIGALKLSQCSLPEINRFRDNLRAAGVGVVTTRRILGSLSRAIHWAMEEGWIRGTNPVKGVRVKAPRDKRGKSKDKVKPPSKSDLALILSIATGGLKMRIEFSARTGVRASELYELRWRDISFNARTLTVTRRVAAEKGRQVDVTKSEAGDREVKLSAQMVKELREWREKAKKKDADDLIFPNARGGHIDHRNMLAREFKPLLAAAAIKAKETKVKFKPFNWHALRHYAISTWIEAGFQPKAVQTMAGHSTLAVTMDIYGHIFPSEDDGDKMDKIAADTLAN